MNNLCLRSPSQDYLNWHRSVVESSPNRASEGLADIFVGAASNAVGGPLGASLSLGWAILKVKELVENLEAFKNGRQLELLSVSLGILSMLTLGLSKFQNVFRDRPNIIG